jgi:hypothetical protein
MVTSAQALRCQDPKDADRAHPAMRRLMRQLLKQQCRC